MGYVVYAIISLVISYAISYAMRPKPKNATAGTLETPMPQPGASVGVSFGTNLFKGTNVIWYGDARTEEVRSKGGKK